MEIRLLILLGIAYSSARLPGSNHFYLIIGKTYTNESEGQAER